MRKGHAETREMGGFDASSLSDNPCGGGDQSAAVGRPRT